MLPEGTYRHPKCSDCIEPNGRKTYVAPDIRIILRQRWCGGRLVNWSICLQQDTVDRGWRDVHRFSVAHANLHAIQSFAGQSRTETTSMGRLNSVDEVEQAYEIANQATYDWAHRYLALWRGETE